MTVEGLIKIFEQRKKSHHENGKLKLIKRENDKAQYYLGRMCEADFVVSKLKEYSSFIEENKKL